MLDFMRRMAIALALALLIGLLFIGTITTYAAENDLAAELNKSLIWPTVGEITDTYGSRDGRHFGIDIAAPEGLPVVSVADGKINRSYDSDTYGEVIFVKHDNGLETVYAHLHERFFEEGEAVAEGEQLGTVGNTGVSSGNHLHFEVHIGNWEVEKSNSIDPFIVLSEEKPYMYAALGEESPYGTGWKKPEATPVLSQKLKEETEVVEVHKAEAEQEKGERDVRTDELETDLHGRSDQTENAREARSDQVDNALEAQVDQPETEMQSRDERSKNELGRTKEQAEPQHPPIYAVVQKDDTLWELAKHFNVRIDDLQKWNGLNNENIHPGEQLVIYPQADDVHMIESGDTLYSIAASHNISVEQLKVMNQLDDDLIFPGDLLVVAESE